MADLSRPQAADVALLVSRELAEKCRKRAEKCRLDAENARNGMDEDAWLDLAEDWIKLAEAFEAAEHLKWN